MNRLFLLRHAEAGVAAPGMTDFDRPLAPRGRRSASLIGSYMRRLDYRPDIALCSPAVRTVETWSMVRETLGGVPVEEFPDEFYNADPTTLFAAMRALDDRHRSAILIGHNPGVLTLALELLGRSVTVANPFGTYPPAALAAFELDTENWRDIAPGKSRLLGFTRPKELDTNA